MYKKITVDEANAWHFRNLDRIPSKITVDAVREIKKHWFIGAEIESILEVGCSDGRIGHELRALSHLYAGVDPSPVAVAKGVRDGLNLVTGWADSFELEQKFDVIILGFFLYLTHPDDWFKIATNIFEHLKRDSFIIINDFYADGLVKKDYKHNPKMNIHKYRFDKLFLWHPAIKSVYHIASTEKVTNINDTDYWYQTTILKVSK